MSDRGESQIIRGFSLKEESEKLQFQLHLTAFRKAMLSEDIAIFLSDMGNKISSYIPLCIFFLIVIVFIGLKIWIIKKHNILTEVRLHMTPAFWILRPEQVIWLRLT